MENFITSSADDSLNLDSLLIQVQPEVTCKWYHFGQALGVDNKILDACLPYPPEQNIIEVCDNWLRNHTGKPSWQEVAEALKRTGIQRLALDIEKVYETGIYRFINSSIFVYIMVALLHEIYFVREVTKSS